MCAARYLRSVSGVHKVSAEIFQISASTLQKAVEKENEEFLQSMLDKYFSEDELVSLYKNRIISEKALNRQESSSDKSASPRLSDTGTDAAEAPAVQEELDLLTEENPLLEIR